LWGLWGCFGCSQLEHLEPLTIMKFEITLMLDNHDIKSKLTWHKTRMPNTRITINCATDMVHRLITKIYLGKVEQASTLKCLPINTPCFNNTTALDTNATLNPSLKRREALTKFLFIVGTCYTFFSCTIFPEVYIYRVNTISRSMWPIPLLGQKNPRQLDKKKRT
jgi:hypothetical protein